MAAWIATRPLKSASAPLTPFAMPNYRLEATAQADRLQAAAEAASAEARRDIQHADDYVLAVVLFSAALFFGGISTRLQRPRPRAVVLGVGCAVLLGTLVWGRDVPCEPLDLEEVRGFMSESTRTGVDNTGAPGPPSPAAEPRWPMATAVLAATILYVGMPHRGRVPGWWVFPVLQLILPGLLVAQDPGRIDRRSMALYRLMMALLVVMTVGVMAAVVVLAYEILSSCRA